MNQADDTGFQRFVLEITSSEAGSQCLESQTMLGNTEYLGSLNGDLQPFLHLANVGPASAMSGLSGSAYLELQWLLMTLSVGCGSAWNIQAGPVLFLSVYLVTFSPVTSLTSFAPPPLSLR